MACSPPTTFPQADRPLLEETVGDMSIEAYIDESDSFRSNSAPFRLPYPLKREALDTETCEHWNTAGVGLRPQINGILQTYGIQHIRWWLQVYNLSKPGYPNGALKTPTVRIELEGSKGRNFGDARDAIFRLLRQHGLNKFHVELIDLERCFEPSLFPLGPEHASVRFYNTIRDELATLISLRLTSRWSAMCIFSVGKTEKLARPSIVVMVKPLTNHNWSTLIVEVNAIILPKLAPGQSLGIEFFPGERGLLTDEPEEPRGKSFAGEDFRFLSPGSSMGIMNGTGGGTVGGFVNLTCNGITRRGILTNYHVVAPPESAPAHILLQADRYGSNISHQDSTRTTAIFMALPDIDATKKVLEANSTRLIKQSDAIREEQRLRIAAEARTLNSHNVQLKNLSAELYKRTTKLDALQQMPYTVGNVLVSSGKFMSSHQANTSINLDWAFVEVSTSVPLQRRLNELPRGSTQGLHIKKPQDYGLDGTYVGDGLILPFQGFSKIEPGHWYFKQGRTTGITTGICHGTELYSPRSGNDLVRYNAEGKEVKATEGVNKEWIILDKELPGLGRPEPIQKTFCLQGDSGSFVVNEHGEVAGLMYGNLRGHCGPSEQSSTEEGRTYVNAGLVTSMDDVLTSIADKTIPRDGNQRPTGPPGVLSLPSWPEIVDG